MKIFASITFYLSFLALSANCQTQTSNCPLIFHDETYLSHRPLFQDRELDISGQGKFTLHTTVPADDDETTHATASFRSKDGHQLLKLAFIDSWPPGWVDYSIANLSGLPGPLVFVSSSSMRADGVDVDTALIAFVDGRFKRIFPSNILTDLTDGICINGKKDGYPASLEILTYTDGDYGIVDWPKYYRLISYVWSGDSFRLVRIRKSHTKYQDWAEAAKGFGVRCDLEILSTTVNQPED